MIAEGSLVVIYLANPREKYWGRLEAMSVAGVFVRGLDLGMVEEWARELARDQEPGIGPAHVFFPLSRVEKIFADEDIGVATSFQTAFHRIVGRKVDEFL